MMMMMMMMLVVVVVVVVVVDVDDRDQGGHHTTPGQAAQVMRRQHTGLTFRTPAQAILSRIGCHYILRQHSSRCHTNQTIRNQGESTGFQPSILAPIEMKAIPGRQRLSLQRHSSWCRCATLSRCHHDLAGRGHGTWQSPGQVAGGGNGHSPFQLWHTIPNIYPPKKTQNDWISPSPWFEGQSLQGHRSCVIDTGKIQTELLRSNQSTPTKSCEKNMNIWMIQNDIHYSQNRMCDLWCCLIITWCYHIL